MMFQVCAGHGYYLPNRRADCVRRVELRPNVHSVRVRRDSAARVQIHVLHLVPHLQYLLKMHDLERQE